MFLNKIMLVNFNNIYKMLTEIKFVSLKISVILQTKGISDNTFIGNAIRGAIKTEFLEKYCKYKKKYTTCLKCNIIDTCPAYYYIASSKEKNFFIRIPYNFTDTTETNIKHFFLTLYGNEVIDNYEVFIECLISAMSKNILNRNLRMTFLEIRDEFDCASYSHYNCDKNKMNLNHQTISLFDVEEYINNTSYVGNLQFFLETPAILEKDNKIISYKVLNFNTIFIFILEKLVNVWLKSNKYNKNELNNNEMYNNIIEFIKDFDAKDVVCELIDKSVYKLKTISRYKCSAIYLSIIFKGNNLTSYYPILKLGEFFGIGRRTAFGFGYYVIIS